MKISIDTDKNSVIITQKFAVKRSVLWKTYTQSQFLDQFWAPLPWETETKSMNFREGGGWIYALKSPDGKSHLARLDYYQIYPLKRFKAVDSFCGESETADESTPRSIWEVSFEELGHETLITEVITFANAQHLNTSLEMGFEHGVKLMMHNIKTSLHELDLNL
jgi:uncharacterized protein YndB with AHSA1/START domain